MPIEENLKRAVRWLLSSRLVVRLPFFLRTLVQVAGKFIIRFLDKRLSRRVAGYPIYVPVRSADAEIRSPS